MRNCPAAVSLACLLLAACSGGGGAGTATAVAPPAVAPVVTPAGPPINLQAANTRVAYPAAAMMAAATTAATGSVTSSASGQGATVTLGTDASGNLNSVIFNLPGNSLQYPVPSSLFSSLSLDSIASTLNDNLGPPGTSNTGALLTQAAAGQTLSASAYGLWASSTSSNTALLGSFAFGNLTPPASVPTTGSATFNGFAIGADTTPNTGSVYAVEGNAQIIANFATRTVTTNLTNLMVANQPYAPAAIITSLPNLSGTSAMSGNAYAGPISGGALTGTINGNFYGTTAQETAGVWQAFGGGNQWIGSFGAK